MDIYTHGHADAVLQSHRRRTAGYLLPSLRSGQDLVDIGCGPGTITVDLARLVAPGSVLGIDIVQAPLGEAPSSPNISQWRSSSVSETSTALRCLTMQSTWCMPTRCCNT